MSGFISRARNPSSDPLPACGLRFIQSEKHCQLKAISNAFSLGLQGRCRLGRHQFTSSRCPKRQPTLEKRWGYACLMLHMSRNGLAFVPTRREHDGRPEVGQFVEMLRPVVDRVIENWPELGVGSDPPVKGPNQIGEVTFQYFGDTVHDSPLQSCIPNASIRNARNCKERWRGPECANLKRENPASRCAGSEHCNALS